MARIFVSGNFTDTGADIQELCDCLDRANNVKVLRKHGDIEEDSGDLIRSSDYFIAVVGIGRGAIVTPTGVTLPQMELELAMKSRIPVIALLKFPNIKGTSAKQEFIRSLIKLRLGKLTQTYEKIEQIGNIVKNMVEIGFEHVSALLKPNKVFISHTSVDKPLVEPIVQRLYQAEFYPFYDKHSIGAGMRLTDTIKRGITEAGYIMLCLSKNTFSSDWVKDEIRWAIEHGDRLGINDEFILPVRLEEFEWPSEFSDLSDIKYADFASNFEKGMVNLLGALMR